MRSSPPLLSIGVVMGLTMLSSCGRDGAATPGAQTQTQEVTQIAPRGQPGLIVRFDEAHPLGRAQALEAQGRCEEAAQLARDTLATQGEFTGLCFDRFTLGGAEIVLKACAPPDDIGEFHQRWIERLEAMEHVEYAEPNLISEAAGCR